MFTEPIVFSLLINNSFFLILHYIFFSQYIFPSFPPFFLFLSPPSPPGGVRHPHVSTPGFPSPESYLYDPAPFTRRRKDVCWTSLSPRRFLPMFFLNPSCSFNTAFPLFVYPLPPSFFHPDEKICVRFPFLETRLVAEHEEIKETKLCLVEF